VKKHQVIIWILVVLLAISQYKLWFGDYGLLWLKHLKTELAEQQSENDRLIQRNEALNAQLQELKSGEDALEERARSQLGLIKEGEIFIQETTPNSESNNLENENAESINAENNDE